MAAILIVVHCCVCKALYKWVSTSHYGIITGKIGCCMDALTP